MWRGYEERGTEKGGKHLKLQIEGPGETKNSHFRNNAGLKNVAEHQDGRGNVQSRMN